MLWLSGMRETVWLGLREFRGVEGSTKMATLLDVGEESTGVSVGTVDEAAVRANLDRLARRFLGMSGDDFLSLRKQGSLDDAEHRPGFTRVLAVATLLD